MPANCRFKQGQIVRLKVEYGDALEGSIGIVDWYLPKKYDQEGVCWARFYDTFSLDLMTDEELKSPGIIELVHQDDLELCTSLPSWLPYELDKKTGGYKSHAKTGEPVMKKLNRMEKFFRNKKTQLELLRKVRKGWQSLEKKLNMRRP